MNESAIKSYLIALNLQKSFHSIHTIEHGIDRLTTSENEKYTIIKQPSQASFSVNEGFPLNPSTQEKRTSSEEVETNKLKNLSIGSKLLILRLAYYQAGKIVLSYLLKTHPKSVFASLWPRRPSLRAVQITANLQDSIFASSRLCELNDRVVACYAGKAAEFLFLATFSMGRPSVFSTLGIEDLIFAQKLVYCMLENWSFYSKKSQSQQTIRLKLNLNTREFQENPEKLEFYNALVHQLEIPPITEALEETSSIVSSKQQANQKNQEKSQLYYSIPWWQQQVSSELEFTEKNFANGSRLYLYNPERNDRNVEWLPPDECYHTLSSLKNVKQAVKNLENAKLTKQSGESQIIKNNNLLNPISTIKEKNTSTAKNNRSLPPARHISKSRTQRYIPWNNVTKLSRDYIVHSLILQSFNKALISLNENRELLDRITITLLSQEVLRKPDIEKLIKDFFPDEKTELSRNATIFEQEQNSSANSLKKFTSIKIVESSWGPKSRKTMPRWIDFAEIQKETT
jgi:hypothetical protein